MIGSGKLVFLLTFFALLIQSLIFFIDKPDELMAIPLTLVLAGAAAYYLSNRQDEDAEFQLNIFLWAFSIRIWVGLILYAWGFSAVVGDEDSSGYLSGWAVAQNWYQNGIDGFLTDLYTVIFQKQNVGQSIIWGIPMFIAGGPSRMIVSVINSFAGSLVVILVFRIARRVFSTEVARIAAIMIAFWASILLLSASTAKEMLVIFFEWSILYLLIRNPKGLTIKEVSWSIPAIIALAMTRFYAVYIMITAYAFRFLVAKRQNLVRNMILGSIVVVGIVAFLGTSGVMNRDFERLERQNQIIDSWRENVAESTGSGVDVYGQYDSPTMAVPVAAVYFFLAPFPWEIFSGTARNAFGGIENILILAILIVGFPALKIVFVDKFVEMAPIFVFCALYAGLHIWGFSNVGLAWRHKQTVMPLLFILSAVGITQRKVGWRIITGAFDRGRKRPISVLPTANRR
jgi:hypothetical protein